MRVVLQRSQFEREFPVVTNESEALESRRKFQLVEDCWKAKSPVYPWGSDEDLVQYSKLLKVSYSEYFGFRVTDFQ